MKIQSLIEKLEQKQDYFLELEEKLADPSILQERFLFQKFSREHAHLSRYFQKTRGYLKIYHLFRDTHELLAEENDPEIREAAKEEIQLLQEQLEKQKREMTLLLLPPLPHEGRNLFIEIRAGTGGEEAALFASLLGRMYLRFAERNGLRTEMIHINSTGLGGYKEMVFSIHGKDVYSLFHQEAGIYRVQRIPVTESGGRIHTSAATVAVLPEREESEIEIDEKDLQIDVFRASGAGGQHVNKTESAIRVTHSPSGIVVSCQDERSQHKNKAHAMNVLRSRLADLREKEIHAEESGLKREQIKSGDRSERIRTYNFPQGRVTDHRIGYTSYNLEALMDGEMDELLEKLIQDENELRLKEID